MRNRTGQRKKISAALAYQENTRGKLMTGTRARSFLIALLLLSACLIGNTAGAGSVKIAADSATIRSMVFDSHGRLWIGTFGFGLWCKDGGAITKFYDQATQQPFPMINNLMIDQENLWIATAGGGCVSLNTSNLKFSEIVQHPGFTKLHGLLKTTTGKMLIGSVGSGSAFLAGNRWKPCEEKQPISLAWVNSIIEWDGRLWLGTSTGLYSTELNIEKWKPEFAGLSRGINFLLVHENKLYIGTNSSGVYVSSPNEEPVKIGGTFGAVHWLVAHQNGLYAIGDASLWKILQDSAESLNAPFVNGKCAIVDNKKNLLIGTMDGKIYRSENGTDYKLIIQYNGTVFEELAK